MADKPKTQNQSEASEPASETPTQGKRVLPTVDPAKTINYRQDGVDRRKKEK